MVKHYTELGWKSLDQPDQINMITKHHMTKAKSIQRRKAARASRKRNRR